MNKLKEWIKNNKWFLLLLIFSFILRLIIVLVINTPVISDFKTMLEASRELLQGETSYKTSPYFLTWAYQMGHVIYQTLLLSIINNITFLKIVNALITTATIAVLYKIGEYLTNKKIALITSFIYSIFLFPLLLNTVLTNQFLPMLLVLTAIYLLIKNKQEKLSIFIIIGLLLSISNTLRSEGIVIITGIVFYMLYQIITSSKKKKKALATILIVLTYFITNITSSTILQVTNISPNGLENKNPAWKFITGLNIETSGMYNEIDATKYAYHPKKANQELEKRIKEDFTSYPVLFLKKIKILWINSDLYWTFPTKTTKELLPLNIINSFFIYFFLILSILSLITIFKKKYKKEQILIYSILFFYFCAYLLIEVMPRYAYSQQLFLVLLTMITLNYFMTKKGSEQRESNRK